MKTFKYLSENKQEIGQKLFTYLLNNPMSIKDLSVKIGISRFIVDNLLQDKSIAMTSLLKIYKFLEEN